MRYFIEFQYKGTNYHGWQRQPNALSVQELMENCLEVLLKKFVTINGSSRTDTGVHANQQFAHFDVDEIIPENLTYKMNSWLPSDISIIHIYKVDEECHSRFDAIGRKYIYRLNETKNPFLTDISWHYPHDLNYELMNEAASILLETNNFQCFSKVKTEVNNFNCNIVEAHWIKKETNYEFHITSNRFLRGMVRGIVGTLLDLGRKKSTISDFKRVLASKDRTKAGINAKAHGLTLEQVKYPENYFND